MPSFKNNKPTKPIVSLPTLTAAESYNRSTKYHDGIPAKVYELLAKGRSKTQCAAYLGISEKTLSNWEKTHEELRDVMEVGETMSAAFWQDLSQRASLGEIEVNPTLFIFNACNQHRKHFTQRNDQNSGVTINNNTLSITDERTQDRLKYLLEKAKSEETV